MTSAAGLAMGGLHPVVALYATFLNRAFDQLLLDVALHRCGVTFVLDRAGVTGPDGPSHHGMWDMSLAQLVPGLRLAAPRDATRLREALDVASQVDDAPTVMRYSKDPVPDDIPAVEVVDGVDVLLRAETAPPRVLLVALRPDGRHGARGGPAARPTTASASPSSTRSGRCPVNPALLRLAAEHELVVTIEDNGVVGGCGARLAQELRQAGIRTPAARVRHRAGVPRARHPRRAAGPARPRPAGHRPHGRRDHRGAGVRARPGHRHEHPRDVAHHSLTLRHRRSRFPGACRAGESAARFEQAARAADPT